MRARRPAGRSQFDDYARARLTELYPPPLVVDAGPARGTEGVYTRYLALPHRSNPKIIVPADHRGAAATAIRRHLAGRRLGRRVLRAVLSTAVRTGATAMLPGTGVHVRGSRPTESVETILAGHLGGERPLLTMPIGPARANRKPVLQVTDSRGDVRAFVKIGHDDLTRALVRREAAALAGLDRSRLASTVAPQVIGLTEWRSLTLLLLSPLELPSLRRQGRAAHDTLLETVREIGRLVEHGDESLETSRFRAALEASLQGCGDRGEPFMHHLRKLDGSGTSVYFAAWHGDLNPGNLAMGTHTTPVWDWERFESGVPFGFDLLHHQLAEAITVRGRPAAESAATMLHEASADLAPLGVDAAQARTTARLYLLTLAARYLGDDQEGAGAALGTVENWILPALDGDPHEQGASR